MAIAQCIDPSAACNALLACVCNGRLYSDTKFVTNYLRQSSTKWIPLLILSYAVNLLNDIAGRSYCEHLMRSAKAF